MAKPASNQPDQQKNVQHKTIVLAGNPNIGKSTLFNQLTGSKQKIANYPGVTVEKKVGQFCTLGGQEITVVDLPGTYSLISQTQDEDIAVQQIKGHSKFPRPDIVAVVI